MFISHPLWLSELRTKEDLHSSCCSKVSICQQVEAGILDMLQPGFGFLFFFFNFVLFCIFLNKEDAFFQILLCSKLKQKMIWRRMLYLAFSLTMLFILFWAYVYTAVCYSIQ